MLSTSDDGLRFAERLLSLIDAGRYSATYKLATLLAIIDLVAEHTDPALGPPTVLHGREVAARVIELYWPQSRGYEARPGGKGRVLSQSPQNDIPAKLAGWRRDHPQLGDGSTLAEAERADPTGWAYLVADLTAVVIGMPLAKLQRFGEGRQGVEDRFIFDFGWREEVKRAAVERAGFDDRLQLRPGVGEWLVRLAPLLRPAVQAKWAAMVSARNREFIDTQMLDDFLFGSQRTSLAAVRDPLLDLQGGDCFYCRHRIGAGRGAEDDRAVAAEVDHFLPWSRRPDNLLDNLVVAHRRCNAAKSASLAGVDHLDRWLCRSRDFDRPLNTVAAGLPWARSTDRTLGGARAAYLWLPDGARLWVSDATFEPVDVARVRALLAA